MEPPADFLKELSILLNCGLLLYLLLFEIFKD